MKLNIHFKFGLLIASALLPVFAHAQGFAWAQGFTGAGSSGAGVKVVDGSNNIYCVGGFTGTIDVDKSANIYNLTSIGQNNMFVLKEDAVGNFIWAKPFLCKSPVNIGFGFTGPTSISLDANGNIYIAGTFSDTMDFDPGPGTFYMMPPIGSGLYLNAFVVKLNPNGDFIWAKQIGGAAGSGVSCDAMQMDAHGNIFLVGGMSGTIDVDPGPNIVNISGTNDLLIEKLDSAGNYVWAKHISLPGGGGMQSLAIDSLSNIYFTGDFLGTADFDPGPNVYNLTYNGGNGDVFIEKLDSAGNFQWAKQVGGSSDDWGQGIAIDLWGNVAVTGYFGDTVDFDPGPGVYNLTSNSTRSIFTLKLRNNGDFVWAQKAGYPTGLYEGRGITTDTAGNVYVVSYGYPMQKFDSSGNLSWTLTTVGTTGWITLDNDNSIYLSGVFSGTQDFDPGPEVYNLTGGSNSGFILKLCQSQFSIPPIMASDTNACIGDTVTLTAPAITGAEYHWSKNYTVPLPDTTATIQVTTTGVYTVRVGGMPCPGYGTVIINFYQTANPSVSLPAAPIYVAAGQPVNVTAAIGNIGTGYYIDWYINGGLNTTTQYTNVLNYIKGAGTDTIVAVIYEPLNTFCNSPDTSNTLIVYEQTTGVTDILQKSGITVYPNPFGNNLTINGLKADDHILLSDVTGRILLSKEAAQSVESLDTKELAAGYYIIKLFSEDGSLKGNVPVVKQ